MDMTIKIKIGSVEVELTLEEAAELHAVLGRICGKPDTVVPPVVAPVVVPAPYYVEYPRLWPYVVTCNSSGITLTVSESSTLQTTMVNRLAENVADVMRRRRPDESSRA